jgi:Ca2+-transporting ATPase
MAFATLVIANLGLILTNRSWSRTFLEMFPVRNEAMLWVVVAAVIFLSISLYVQPFAAIFQFSPPGPGNMAICIGAGVLSVVWFEVLKIANRILIAAKRDKNV